MSYDVQIIGPDGQVHYTRPIDDESVGDALRTPGYGVRWPGCRNMHRLDDLPRNCKAEITWPAEGLTASCPDPSPVPCTHCGAVHLPRCNVNCNH